MQKATELLKRLNLLSEDTSFLLLLYPKKNVIKQHRPLKGRLIKRNRAITWGQAVLMCLGKEGMLLHSR